jgi:cytochrome c peroxidase
MYIRLRPLLPALIVAPLALLAACQDAPTGALAPDPEAAGVALSRSWGLPPFDPDMAELGDLIFDDEDLSIGRNQSCASCHDAEWGFTGPSSEINAAGAVFEGSIPGRFGDRKPPSSAYSTLSPVFRRLRQGGGTFVGGSFWDGRATGERLGSPAAEQAQGPFLNPVEQGLRDEACVVYRVGTAVYASEYRQVFGTGIDSIQYPAAIDALCALEGPRLDIDPANRQRIEREYDNIAIAIAMYEESHNLFSSRFDAARRGLVRLTPQEQRGFLLFQGKARCGTCHTASGSRPAFTDQRYDNLGVPPNPLNPRLLADPSFRDPGLGGFLATRPEWQRYAAAELGRMRVPTLRNVDLRPADDAIKAYMHNGVFRSLEEVVHFYNTRDVLERCDPSVDRDDPRWGTTCWPAPEVPQNMNTLEVGNLGLTAEEEAAVVAYLRTLSDGFIPGGRGRHLRGGR